MILYIFGNSVYFVFGLVYFDLRVGTTDGVDFSIDLLFFEDGSLPDADCQLPSARCTFRSAAGV